MSTKLNISVINGHRMIPTWGNVITMDIGCAVRLILKGKIAVCLEAKQDSSVALAQLFHFFQEQ